LKKVKLDKNKPFGINVAEKLVVGELVEWYGWYLDINGDCIHETYQGILIEIISERLGGRDVLYGKVLPISNNTVFDVNIFCLRKVKQKETN
tara:strand:- start:1260 stop:1535 length:276 start_codon:yes stop_codon:yes gene_type:complete